MKTEAEKRAQRKYQNKMRQNGQMAQLNISMSSDDKLFIKENAEKNRLSQAQFVLKACRYCVDNNIQLNDIDDND
ncbi:MAG: hypothetical protein IJO91_09710 [Oscillospiraceae bacterium]|nr:hypothetical protein [Oscillospiraceae bacterium]